MMCASPTLLGDFHLLIPTIKLQIYKAVGTVFAELFVNDVQEEDSDCDDNESGRAEKET